MSAQTTSPQASPSIFSHSRPTASTRDLIEEAVRRGYELDRSGELCDRPHPRMRTRPQPPQSARSRSETISRKRQRENTGSWIGAAHSCRAVPRPSGGLSQPIHAATTTVGDFPLRPRGRIPREAKSPPSAVLRSSLRPARASRVLARLARLLSAATRGTDGMSRRPEETERRNEHP